MNAREYKRTSLSILEMRHPQGNLGRRNEDPGGLSADAWYQEERDYGPSVKDVRVEGASVVGTGADR